MRVRFLPPLPLINYIYWDLSPLSDTQLKEQMVQVGSIPIIPTMKKLDNNIIQKITTLYKEGKSMGYIARELNISKSSVSNYINIDNISRYKKPIEISSSLLESMQEDYNSGMSRKAIGKKYKVALYRLEKLQKPEATSKYNILKKRRVRIKEELVEYKGGKCEICGYNKCLSALEFHHLDPSKKDFGIASNSSYKNINILKKEIDKCILVCSNCHREIHSEIIKLKDF